jgi:hypothetical protein
MYTGLSMSAVYIKTDKDSDFTRSHAEFLLSFSIDQSFKRLSKLVRVGGTLENFQVSIVIIVFSKIIFCNVSVTMWSYY